MGTRIRYKEMERRPNVFESVRRFRSDRTGAEYIVRLDLNNFTYEIKNLRSEHIYRGGENVNNLNVLKRTVKKRLTDLGVSFTNEERDRTFGLCDKGYTQKEHRGE